MSSMSTGVSIPRQASDGTFLPSARDISLAVHKDVDNPHLHLTAMAAIWGQLVHNDISHTPQMAGELIVFSSLVGEPPCVVFIIPIYPQPLSPPSSPPFQFFCFFRHVTMNAVVGVGQLSLRISEDWPPLTCVQVSCAVFSQRGRQLTRFVYFQVFWVSASGVAA